VGSTGRRTGVGGRRAFNVLSGLFDERADDLRWHDGCKIAELAGGDAGDLPVQSEQRAAGISRIDVDIAVDGILFNFANDACG
jgi:hypothetical protein